MSRHTGPMTDNYIQALRRRTELRLGHSRLQLGERWLLHPTNAIRADLAGKMKRIASEYLNVLGKAGLVEPTTSWMAEFKAQAVGRELRL